MGGLKRRKLDRALLGAGAVVVGLGAMAGAYFVRPERMRSMWAGAEIGGGGVARVTEVIDWDFGRASKHGIFRVVPDLSRDAPVHVDSPDAPDGMLVTQISGGTQIRIGDPYETVSGAHRYQIDYPLPGTVQGGELAWDAVGTDWSVGIDQIEVHVVAPFELDDVACFAGSAGSQAPCDDVRVVEPGHLVATADGLGAYEGLTVTAERGSALASASALPEPPGRPGDPGAGVILPAVVAALAALAGAAVGLWLVRRAGREHVVVGAGGAADAAFAQGFAEVRIDATELAAMATTDFAPPEGITASQGGIVLAEKVRKEHRVAWLIEAALDGTIELTNDLGAMTLVRRAPGSRWTAAILDQIFGGREKVWLGSYDPYFSVGWRNLGAQLDGWRAGSGLWDERARKLRGTLTGIGAVVAAVGFLVAVLGAVAANRSGVPGLVVVACGGLLAGAGHAPIVAGWELLVRTAMGSAVWLRVESFRRFLAGSEAHHAEEAAERGVLREYTAWAVAVGEIDRWTSAVDASTVIPAEVAWGDAYVAPILLDTVGPTLREPRESFSEGGSGGWSDSFGSSSSGGSSGGGGGSVGSGAGGGGGGSW